MKMLRILMTVLVFATLLLPLRAFSPNPASEPKKSAPKSSDSDGQNRISVETIGSGGIPMPRLPKTGGFSLLAADSSENLIDEAVYNDLYEAMVSRKPECDLDKYKLTRNRVSELFSDVINHSPELFYVDGKLALSYNKATGIVRSVSFTYTMEPEEIERAVETYNQEIDRILEQMPEGMGAVDQALWLHDYLCVRYGFDSGLQNYDAYSFFMEKRGVCQGYTMAYMALLQKCGIGTDFAASSDMNHIWNLIELDGQWYHVDVTWDDPVHTSGADIPGRAGHDNFLCSDTAIAKTGHYNWTSRTCSSKLYDGTYLDGIQSAMAYLDGVWYCADRQDGSIRTLTLPTMENRVLFKADGIWYRWGESLYYVYHYVNLCSMDGKIYYSMPTSIGCFDPLSQTFDPPIEYTGGEGYIYALYAEGRTLHYAVSTAPAGGEIREYTLDVPLPPETQTPPTSAPDTDVPPTTEEKPEEYPNLSSKDEAAESLISCTAGENGQTLRVLMIGNQSKLCYFGSLCLVAEFTAPDGTILSCRFPEENLSFCRTITDQNCRFSAAEGYFLFGFTVDGIPLQAWTSVTVVLTEESTGKILYDVVLENNGQDSIVWPDVVPDSETKDETI